MAFFFDSDEAERNPEFYHLNQQFPRRGYDYFKQRLHQEILRSQRREHPFTLMRISFNTSEEQETDVQDVLKASIREYDLLCLVEKDDYAIVFPETTEQYAEIIAQRIREKIDRAWIETNVEPCIGIACFPQDGTNAEDLLDSVERELRICKRDKNPG